MESLADLKAAADTARANEALRNERIVAARVDGWPWAKIAEAAGLTPMGVQNIARRLNGGQLPKPRQQR